MAASGMGGGRPVAACARVRTQYDAHCQGGGGTSAMPMVCAAATFGELRVELIGLGSETTTLELHASSLK